MAIAFDNATTPTISNNVTSKTFSHTVGASAGMALFVAVGLPTSDLISGVTYAGVGMTLVNKVQGPSPNSRYTYLFFLANPATGANNVIISASGTADALGATAVSYSGVYQLSTVDNSTTNTNTGATSISTSLTTVANNCWTIMVGRTSGTSMTAGSGTHSRGNLGDTSAICGDSNGAITPAGSTSMAVTWTSSGSAGVCMASFAPQVIQSIQTSPTVGVFTLTGFAITSIKKITSAVVTGVFSLVGYSITSTNSPNKWPWQKKSASPTWRDQNKS